MAIIKEVKISYLKKSSIKFIAASVILQLGFCYIFIYKFPLYYKAPMFFWGVATFIAIAFIAAIHDYFDKRPVLQINNTGIRTRIWNRKYTWSTLGCYSIKRQYNENVSFTVVNFYDKRDDLLLTIDLTDTNKSIEQIDKALRKHLRRKAN